MEITKLKKYITDEYIHDKKMQKCFWSSLFFALIAYLYCFVNNLNNYDSIAATPIGTGKTVSSGRWLLNIIVDGVHKFWGSYNIPWLNGLFSILILAIVVCLLVKALDVKSEILSVLIGGITVVFPAIASGMFFMYTINFYTISILLGVIGIMCVTKGKIIGVFITGLLFSMSLGIYQAYYPYIVSLLLLLLIKMSLDNKYSWKQVLVNGLKCLVAIILGYIFYRIFLSLTLKLYHRTLWDYQGVDSMGILSFNQIISCVIEAYKRFLILPIRDYMSITISYTLKLGVLGIYIITFISTILSFKNNNKIKSIILILLLAIFPLAVNLIIIMVPKGDIYTLMCMGVVGVFYLPIIFVDNLDKTKINTILKRSTVIILFACILNYIWLTNGNFRELYYANARVNSYNLTMYTRIKSMSGYNQNKEIIFIGSTIEDDTYYNRWENTPFKYGGNRYTINNYSRKEGIENYLGYRYREIKIDSEEYLKYKEEILTMNRYPDDGSIKVLDDVILVRFE